MKRGTKLLMGIGIAGVVFSAVLAFTDLQVSQWVYHQRTNGQAGFIIDGGYHLYSDDAGWTQCIWAAQDNEVANISRECGSKMPPEYQDCVDKQHAIYIKQVQLCDYLFPITINNGQDSSDLF